MLSFIFSRIHWNFAIGMAIVTIGCALVFGVLSAIHSSEVLAGIGGVFAALVAVQATILVQIRRDEIEQSHFYLKSALQGFNDALDYFENNNDRVRWIAGARVLAHVEKISQAITESAHRNVFEMHREEMRHHVAQVLGYDDHQRGADFFRGFSGHSSSDAEDSPRTRELDLSSIAVLLKFSDFPAEYDDPLNGYRLTREDASRLRHTLPALSQYLAARLDIRERRRAE